ncbi:unnamed protein product [Phytomonas sp. Hart1]|nr:unnamed protein product [Phytomonas sp. Hart1]|eukprot:CCW69022.1 unnamed protein product [Phytomonas sp. isolate Hart1]
MAITIRRGRAALRWVVRALMGLLPSPESGSWMLFLIASKTNNALQVFVGLKDAMRSVRQRELFPFRHTTCPSLFNK